MGLDYIDIVKKSGFERLFEKLSDLLVDRYTSLDGDDFINFCLNDLRLNVIGLMCLPPINVDPVPFFKKLNVIGTRNNLNNFSMGMSQDYLQAINLGATYVRIGSGIFGIRN